MLQYYTKGCVVVNTKKKKAIIVLCALAVFAAAGAAVYRSVARPLEIEYGRIEVHSFSDYDLNYYKRFLEEHRENNKNAIDYINKDFKLDGVSEDYCTVMLTYVFNNSGKIRITEKGLIPRKDNDVIGFSVASLKNSSFSPGETGKEKAIFICRRNGMSDEEIADYIGGLDFIFLQNSKLFGEKRERVSFPIRK